MTTQRSKQVAQLIYLAGQMDKSQRAEFLRHACAGEPDLRRQVDGYFGNAAMRPRRWAMGVGLVLLAMLATIPLIRSEHVSASPATTSVSGRRMADEFNAVVRAGESPARTDQRQSPVQVGITTDPEDAEMTVDGVPVDDCRTPCSLKLAAGTHTLGFYKPGYRDTIREVRVTRSGDLPVVELSKPGGKLYLQSEPSGATIVIDGVEQPEQTPTNLVLAVGTRRIELKLGASRDAFSIDVTDGDVRHMSIPMP